jgi:hypothetical protein
MFAVILWILVFTKQFCAAAELKKANPINIRPTHAMENLTRVGAGVEGKIIQF